MVALRSVETEVQADREVEQQQLELRGSYRLSAWTKR